jgi:hypothetical protein
MRARLEAGEAFLSTDLKEAFFEDLARHVEACVDERSRGSVPADLDAVMAMLHSIANGGVNSVALSLDTSGASGSGSSSGSGGGSLTMKDRAQATEWIEHIENPRRARRSTTAMSSAFESMDDYTTESASSSSSSAASLTDVLAEFGGFTPSQPRERKHGNGLGGRLFLKGERSNMEEAVLQIAGSFRDEAIGWERIRTRAGLAYRPLAEIIAYTCAFLDLCHRFMAEIRPFGAVSAAASVAASNSAAAAAAADGDDGAGAAEPASTDASIFKEAKRRLLEALPPGELPPRYFVAEAKRKKKTSPTGHMAISRAALLLLRRDRTAASAAKFAGYVCGAGWGGGEGGFSLFFI